MSYEAGRTPDAPTYFEVLERVEALLDDVEPTIYSFPSDNSILGKLIDRVVPSPTEQNYTNTVRRAAAPVGGGGWRGVTIEETSQYSKDSPEVRSRLAIFGWMMETQPAAIDYSSWREKVLWKYELAPGLDDEKLAALSDVLDRRIDITDGRLLEAGVTDV